MLWYWFTYIYTALHWVWDFVRGNITLDDGTIVDTTIYGVSIFQVGVIFILVTLFFRAFVIPTIGGQGFHAGLWSSHSNLSKAVNSSKSAAKNFNKMEVEKL